MSAPTWLWIPITLWAAFAQTIRNAAQKSLTTTLGTFGATFVRFIYGLPFAVLWLLLVKVVGGYDWPRLNATLATWIFFGSLAQIAATALLLRVMAERNFALGVAYTKSDVLQVAVFGFVFLGDAVSVATAIAILIGTVGVLFLSPPDPQRPLRSLLMGWTTPTAFMGVTSGAGFAFAAVSFRGAALSLTGTPFPLAAAYTLVVGLVLQTLLLGGWLAWRRRDVVVKTLLAWRASWFAGLMGAAASAGWFTAMTIEPAVHVRMLGLVELLFTYAVARRVFNEGLSRRELTGMGLLSVGLVLVMLAR